MFNSPVLDIAIGLVFVFLLYSLLATSIKEAIATLFNLRASMLKQGIINSMLSDTSKDYKLQSIVKGIWKLIVALPYLMGLIPKKKEEEKKIGDKFYDHPLIKNYGASRIYPHPSYIPPENFSTVLIDVLKDDFGLRIDKIVEAKKILLPNQNISDIKTSLENSSTVLKIKELLEYYQSLYKNAKKQSLDVDGKTLPVDVDAKTPPLNLKVCEETCKILLMHLKNSVYSLEDFSKKLEGWFNDTMDRVSGWYKRQVQLILFIIGLVMAIMFNVDTIDIADKLTTDKDARDKIVQLAIKGVDQYKNDPRVKPSENKEGAIYDSIQKNNENVFNEYKAKMDSVKNELKGNIDTAKNLLAMGWGEYGRDDVAFLKKLKSKHWIGFLYWNTPKRVEEKFHDDYDSLVKISDSIYDTLKHKYSAFYDTLFSKDPSKHDSLTKRSKYVQDSLTIESKNSVDSMYYNFQYEHYTVNVKTAYVWYEVTQKKKKLLGFFILAFAVCLGAPFWFDLLSKIIKLRGSGKQESTNDNNDKVQATNNQPTNITVNTQKNGEEAVG
ncbi:MAG: hypothetical protein ABI402_14380 [Ferruginibacter sp.]